MGAFHLETQPKLLLKSKKCCGYEPTPEMIFFWKITRVFQIFTFDHNLPVSLASFPLVLLEKDIELFLSSCIDAR